MIFVKKGLEIKLPKVYNLKEEATEYFFLKLSVIFGLQHL